ncbi:MAG TPA: MFS transporter, partial [Ardenticatenaceae bacterium]|nr:MFS transporter [Ardenticatenaceae bacterium]
PWVGERSDRTWTRWGRRFPYIMVGAPIAAVGGALIPIGAARGLVLLVAAMLLMNLAMAVFRSPTVALLGDVFPPELRSRANGVINFMGLVAAVIAFLVGGIFYKLNPAYPFWAAGAIMLGVLLLLLAFVREPADPYSETEVSDAREQGVLPTLRRLIANPDRSALLILVALLMWSIGITALQAFFTLYGKMEMGLNEGTASQLLSFYPLAGLLFAIPGGYLGTYLGRRRTLLLCLALLFAVLVSFLFVTPDAVTGPHTFNLLRADTWFANPTTRILIILLMAAGAALTVITVNVLPMLFDAAPTGRIGSYTGLYYLFGSLASISGPPLAGQIVDLTGSYRTIFLFTPFFVAVAFILIWAVRGGEVGSRAAEDRVPSRRIALEEA